MKTVVFFNNKGGVGKTTFSYHLGYSLERAGKRVLFVDADPQCNLTSWICSGRVIDLAWKKVEEGQTKEYQTLYDAVQPIVSGAGDIKETTPYHVPGRNIWIYIGDLLLSDFESELSNHWTQVLAAQERGFRVTSAIYRLITKFAAENSIDYILIDIGPNLGALNRAMLLSCDTFIIPMIPDMFSLRGSQNIGRVFAGWISDYQFAKRRAGDFDFECAPGRPQFSGYVLQQFNRYGKRTTKAFDVWKNQIPDVIRKFVVGPLTKSELTEYDLVQNKDDYKLAEFRNYNSMIPKAQKALKPIFELTRDDGVVGGHMQYVERCAEEFSEINRAFTEGI